MRGAYQLDFSRHGLASLPDTIGQLTKLERLYLAQNQLTSLPESIGQLTQLQELYVDGNQLTSLPESIGQLTQLRRLSLSKNRLINLPQGISQLTHLRSLDLSSNQLTELPDSIGQFTRLELLDLSNNLLEELPTSMAGLKSLIALQLYGNDHLGLPLEITGGAIVCSECGTPNEVGWSFCQMCGRRLPKGPDELRASEILEYYFRVRSGNRPLNEAKLILVGRGAVGKTSIVNRLVHNRFDKDEGKTEGIRITEWPIRLETNENVRLNIWDFGGQEIMHATHQFFLTERSLYLVILNGREGGGDADAEYWLKLIESFGGESPVIIVLNKINEHSFDLNRRGLQQKYPAIRDF